MISLKELNPHGHKLTPDQQENLDKLHTAMNEIRSKYGKPMIVTSGFRSEAEHIAIYAGKRGQKVPMGSAHLKGAACDIWDRDQRLWNWVLKNMSLMERLGIYLEDKKYTPTWVHFQIIPPKSGNRIFIP